MPPSRPDRQSQPEAWLRGPVPDIPPLLQPAAHALLQVAEDVEVHVSRLDRHQVWDETHGAASIGFHCRHLAGATDRLLTYARGEALSVEQREVMARESGAAAPDESAPVLVARVREAVDRALAQFRATPSERLLDAREVGRGRLPSTVLGLLMHAAEHASRHAGQLTTTAIIVRRWRGEITPPAPPATPYVGSLHADAPELERLRLLQELWDPISTRRLSSVGVLTGWRCLEVGGGAGSIARWLAARVGPSGYVVVTDHDPRFLETSGQAGIEVRRHDILHDPVEPDAFDFVHCRALLMHLSDPDAAVARMVAALKPGGWLVVEEPDYGSMCAATPEHPHAAWFDRTWEEIRRTLIDRRIANADYGRTAPDVLRRAGLVQVEHEGTCRVTRGGESAARLAQAHHRLLGIAGVLTDLQVAQLNHLCDDSRFSFVEATLYGAWGQRAPRTA